jgi:hypothetical protein
MILSLSFGVGILENYCVVLAQISAFNLSNDVANLHAPEKNPRECTQANNPGERRYVG